MLQPPVPNFCADCGNSEMILRIPPGDERLRACCDRCGRVEYSNPKIVVATVVRVGVAAADTDEDDDSSGSKILLAKRAIEPRRGTWGIPQGYMEHGETTRQAALREVQEETGVTIRDPSSLQLRAIYNVPGSVQVVYEAIVTNEQDIAKIHQEIQAYNNHQQGGGESQEVSLLTQQQIAEKELCFPTVEWALKHCWSLQSTSSAVADATTAENTFLTTDNNFLMPRQLVQQMTKVYNPETQLWSQYEDEAINIIMGHTTTSNNRTSY
jgi:ADP-ribose pyrophosphatase YjhB (NUDIX family)